MKLFKTNQEILKKQFENVEWIEESGVGEKGLKKLFDELIKEDNGENRDIIKAKVFALICEKSRIAIDKEDIFQDKLFDCNFISTLRNIWLNDAILTFLPKEGDDIAQAFESGSCFATADFGHASSNTRLLLKVGFSGLLVRIEQAERRENLSNKQKQFYRSCKIVLNACITFVNRLADAIAPFSRENELALRRTAIGAPTNIYEAMQLLIVYFFLQEYIYKTRLRTLGRLDVLLYPFYKKDIEDGVFTKTEIKEMLKFFLNKFSSAKVPYGLPFCLAGIDENGEEVTNEISYLIVEAYQELDIYSPKIHIRVSDKTPANFIKIVLNSIRNGKNSFVFCNDNIACRALTDVGIEQIDAKNYVPIGCYEPAVWGDEIGCTGNSGVNLAKAIEYVMMKGVDAKSGKKLGADVGELNSFNDFYFAVKKQIEFLTKKCINYVCTIEKYYKIINPDSLLSCMNEKSIEQGVDVYEGGAKYNNSSVIFFSIATLVDSLTAIKVLVYDKKILSLSEYVNVLKDNWKNNEKLRLMIRKMPEKYGNENEMADYFTKDISNYCAELVNNQPNGRGGMFKASLFSIDYCYDYGKKVMATPDGRKEGESLSKNLCASWAMDKNGILSLINSVTKIDQTKFPNGSVLDVVLHPSAVTGQDGLDAFYGILKTYFEKGGFAMHANVFDANDLREAQKNPDKYSTLQVRLCGWNAYFVALRKEEQDSFIKQAENLT